MAVLFFHRGESADEWLDPLKAAMPDVDFRRWPDVGEAADITFAIVWQPERGALKRFPNLKGILNLGAGVEYVLGDPGLPDVPLGRIVDDRLSAGMSEYVVLHVLRQHRQMPEMSANQKAARWVFLPPADTLDTAVGILGLGVIGRDIAAKLRLFGFPVVGWSRSGKSLEGIESFHGSHGLTSFLGRCRFLVCVLPLTPETQGILNARTLAALPQGAHLINIGRGGHVVDEDLLAALESGHVASATLDVFNQEPLPAGHPYWRHPKVTISPHNASDSEPRYVVPQIVENVRRVEAGHSLLNPVDRKRGY